MSCHFTVWQRNARDFSLSRLSREGYPEEETSCVLSAYCRPAAYTPEWVDDMEGR